MDSINNLDSGNQTLSANSGEVAPNFIKQEETACKVAQNYVKEENIDLNHDQINCKIEEETSFKIAQNYIKEETMDIFDNKFDCNIEGKEIKLETKIKCESENYFSEENENFFKQHIAYPSLSVHILNNIKK